MEYQGIEAENLEKNCVFERDYVLHFTEGQMKSDIDRLEENDF